MACSGGGGMHAPDVTDLERTEPKLHEDVDWLVAAALRLKVGLRCMVVKSEKKK